MALLAPSRETPRQTAVRRLFCACGLTALIVGSAAFLRWRHLYCLLPVGLVFAAGVLARGAPGPRPGPFAHALPPAGRGPRRALGLAGVWPVLTQADHQGAEYDRVARELASFVARHTPEDALVLTETDSGMS